MYAGPVTTTAADARWARGLAVALVTAPGVLLAQLVVAGSVPSLPAAGVVCGVVAAVGCVGPARSGLGAAAVAASAQLAGNVVLALAAPQADARGGCLSVVRRGGDLGIRYAVEREGAGPPAAVGAGPALAAVLAAVAAAALVLVGSAVLAVLTGALVVVLAAGVELARRLAGAVLPALSLLGVRPVPAGTPVPPLSEPLLPAGRRPSGR